MKVATLKLGPIGAATAKPAAPAISPDVIPVIPHTPTPAPAAALRPRPDGWVAREPWIDPEELPRNDPENNLYPQISFYCDPPSRLDPMVLIDIIPGPFKSLRSTVAHLESNGFVSFWTQHGILAWARRDFGNLATIHGCQPVRVADGWEIRYLRIVGRGYLRDDPGRHVGIDDRGPIK